MNPAIWNDKQGKYIIRLSLMDWDNLFYWLFYYLYIIFSLIILLEYLWCILFSRSPSLLSTDGCSTLGYAFISPHLVNPPGTKNLWQVQLKRLIFVERKVHIFIQSILNNILIQWQFKKHFLKIYNNCLRPDVCIYIFFFSKFSQTFNNKLCLQVPPPSLPPAGIYTFPQQSMAPHVRPLGLPQPSMVPHPLQVSQPSMVPHPQQALVARPQITMASNAAQQSMVPMTGQPMATHTQQSMVSHPQLSMTSHSHQSMVSHPQQSMTPTQTFVNSGQTSQPSKTYIRWPAYFSTIALIPWSQSEVNIVIWWTTFIILMYNWAWGLYTTVQFYIKQCTSPVHWTI